jgi:hypothetical protein
MVCRHLVESSCDRMSFPREALSVLVVECIEKGTIHCLIASTRPDCVVRRKPGVLTAEVAELRQGAQFYRQVVHPSLLTFAVRFLFRLLHTGPFEIKKEP